MKKIRLSINKAINNISSLFTRFSLVDALIKTVKLSIAEPNDLESSWHQDNQGNRQIEMIWQPTENHYEFICRNLFDPERRYEGDSTRKCLVFIETLMNMLKK